MKMADSTILREIQSASESAGPIPTANVRRWQESSSLEVRAAITYLILENSRRIEPALGMQDICRYVSEYYRELLSSEISNEYIPPLHIADGIRSMVYEPME